MEGEDASCQWVEVAVRCGGGACLGIGRVYRKREMGKCCFSIWDRLNRNVARGTNNEEQRVGEMDYVPQTCRSSGKIDRAKYGARVRKI